MLFEHPLFATSWAVPEMKELLEEFPQLRKRAGDQCAVDQAPRQMYDRRSKQEVWAWVRKPTGWLTNCEEIGDELGRRCPGGHDHLSLMQGNAKQAEEYSAAVCLAILRGLRQHLDSHNCLGSWTMACTPMTMTMRHLTGT